MSKEILLDVVNGIARFFFGLYIYVPNRICTICPDSLAKYIQFSISSTIQDWAACIRRGNVVPMGLLLRILFEA
jgi:hypothetical protein